VKEKSVVEKSSVSSRAPGGSVSCMATSRVCRQGPAVDMKAQRLLMKEEELSMPVWWSKDLVAMLRWWRS